MKLTDKPLSFGYSVVDSHPSCRPVKAKTRQLTLTSIPFTGLISKNPPKRIL
ncbi:hypothetical protein SA12_2899 [Salmonella enterica subsp. enterica serovar Agona str. 12.A.06]|nr:hypothetical protein SA12_2899 [Salmonella enterica subsp. enterica serovar Agona str. 12.A.06]